MRLYVSYFRTLHENNNFAEMNAMEKILNWKNIVLLSLVSYRMITTFVSCIYFNAFYWATGMKTFRLVFVLCLLASTNIVQAQHVSDKAYKGGNFTLEFGAFTSAGSKIPFTGFSLTPVGGYTFSEHLFLGGGVSFCFNTVGNFFSMSTPVFARGKYSLLKSRITPYVLLDAGYDPLFVSVDYEISESYVPSHGDLWIYGTRGGFYLRPELGVSLRLRRRKNVNFGIGYCRQRGDFKRMELQNGRIEATNYSKVGKLTFRCGFTF